MKRTASILILFLSITNLFAQSEKINFKTFEKDYMVEILPEGQKKTLNDFAGTKGPQDIFAYSIGKYEVTQELYQAVMGTNPSEFKGPKLPVEQVTWYDAVYFCNELTKVTMGAENCCYTITNISKNDDGNITRATVTWEQSKKGYRLPTEAEWEMAARGGTKGGWDYKYSGSNDIDEVAWSWENSNGTNDVGTKKANMAGLYDMSGNVEEWCWNTWTWSKSFSLRVRRGGGYYDGIYCAVSLRHSQDPYPYDRGSGLGFRVCRGNDTISIDEIISSDELNFKNFEKKYMVEIIPEGQKKTLNDFDGTDGPQNIFAYSIGKYEVTQALYQSVMGTNPSWFKGPKLPIECVTWYDAVYFCNELTKMTMGEEDCCYKITNISKNDVGNIEEATVTWDQNKKGYRLPTEAEWEMAARGGVKGGWDYWFSGSDEIEEVAWFRKNSNNKTHDVGTKQSNKAGLYDMSGNVWEWCWNAWSQGSSDRVRRGGSWNNGDDFCTVSDRRYYYPYGRSSYLGFRVCRGL